MRASRRERNLEWDMTFSFYSALQWSNDVCGIYRTYGTQSQSGFHCFSTSTQQTWVVSGLPAVSVNCIDTAFRTGPVRNTCIVHMRKIPQNVQKSLVAGAPPQTPQGELTTLPQTLYSRRAWDRINSQLDCHPTSYVPPLKKRQQFS